MSWWLISNLELSFVINPTYTGKFLLGFPPEGWVPCLDILLSYNVSCQLFYLGIEVGNIGMENELSNFLFPQDEALKKSQRQEKNLTKEIIIYKPCSTTSKWREAVYLKAYIDVENDLTLSHHREGHLKHIPGRAKVSWEKVQSQSFQTLGIAVSAESNHTHTSSLYLLNH